MKKINDKQMQSIKGGSITGSLWSALVRGFTTFSDIGRFAGSAIRRMIGRNMCGF